MNIYVARKNQKGLNEMNLTLGRRKKIFDDKESELNELNTEIEKFAFGDIQLTQSAKDMEYYKILVSILQELESEEKKNY